MSGFPVPKQAPPGLSSFLSGEPWKEWQKSGLVFDIPDLPSSIRYLRNKPESCRLFISGTEPGTADSPPQGMNVRLFSTLSSAKEFHEKIVAKNLGASSAH